ncbi:MAG: DUF4920 domain-containing protein [Flavobacteriaceae bacterium]|nr:DUF4920 domain-containing protein [Flavobacteriaceae bacterium]
MRVLGILLLVFCLTISCKKDEKQEVIVEETVEAKPTLEFIGTQFEIKREKSLATIKDEYAALKPLDTNYVAFKANVNSVCQKKGCWMRLALDDEKEIFVKFKDYGFFMPKNLEGEVMVNGYAFVEETSVEDLKHFAEDAGKSEEEIAAITEPELTYSFIADGVMIEK